MKKHIDFMREQGLIEESLAKIGWEEVWKKVSKNIFSIRTVAIVAAEHSQQLEGRPPLDAFWLSGASVQSKFLIDDKTRAEVFFYWLEHHTKSESTWDVSRLGFETLYLINTGFIDYGTVVEIYNQKTTLAEALLESVSRPEIESWNWDWSKVTKQWIQKTLNVNVATPGLVCMLKMLDKNRVSGWSAEEVRIAEQILNKKQGLSAMTMSVYHLGQWLPVIENYRLAEAVDLTENKKTRQNKVKHKAL